MSSRTLFFALIAAAIAFVAGFGVATAVNAGRSDATQPQVVTATQTVFPPPTYAAAPSSSASPSPTGKPTVVLTEAGAGEKSTRTFTVTGDWDLWYSYSCAGRDNFMVQTDSGDSLVNEISSGRTDTTHQHDSGTFSLKVLSGCDWKVKIIQLP